MNKPQIVRCCAREILDSRGNPTVEATVFLADGTVGVASVPSGASTGIYEACELRDGDRRRYFGKGVLEATANVAKLISPAISGLYASEQAEIDRVLGDVSLTIKEFAETLESGAEADEMNLIPTSIDEVTVAPPEKMLSSVKRRLFAVGMTSGVPAVTADTAFLSDKELGLLEARGVNIDPRIS